MVEIDSYFRGCLVERSKLPQIGDIDRGSVFDEEFGDLIVAIRASVVEGDQSTLVLGMDIGAL